MALTYKANFDTTSYARKDFGTIEQIKNLISDSHIKEGTIVDIEGDNEYKPYIIGGVEYMANANGVGQFYLPSDFTIVPNSKYNTFDNTDNLKTGDIINNNDVINKNAITKAALLINGLSTLGFASGLFFAYKKKSGVLGYIGFGLLGSIGGYAIGTIGSSIFNFSNNK